MAAVNNPNAIDADRLSRLVQPRRIGRTLLCVARTTSTNDLCWRRLEEAGPEADGFVAIADFQTAGRGRFGRTWLAPPGSSVLLSALLLQRPQELLIERLSLLAGIAACQAVRSASGIDLQLRWPNDLICNGRKIGGILLEARAYSRWTAVVLGVGINCLQQPQDFDEEIRNRAASLQMLAGTVDRLTVAAELIKSLDRHLAQDDLPPAKKIKDLWLALAEPIGKRIRLLESGKVFEGTSVELDPTGGLIVQLDSGGRRIFRPQTTTLLEVNDGG